ncbi:hypothetical protein [Candidatus Hodarchaeum mangrovi]
MTQSIQETDLLEKENEKEFAFELVNQTDKQVLDVLTKIEPATRTDICKKTGIARTTIYDALTRLILYKKVVKYSVPGKSKGRPKVFYRIS